ISWGALTNLPANLDTDSTDDFDGAYGSLSGSPTNVSSFTNDAGYLTAIGGDIATDLEVAAATSTISWGALTNLPANLDTDSTNDITTSQITDIGSGEVIKATERVKLNQAIIVGDNISDLVNDSSYATSTEVDTATSTISWIALTNLPVNLDTDSTDDFDGAYGSLSGSPTNVSSFTNDAGYLTGVGAEIATDLEVAAATSTISWGALTNLPANLDTDSTNDITTSQITDIGSGEVIKATERVKLNQAVIVGDNISNLTNNSNYVTSGAAVFTGTINTNSNWISGDGGSEGILVDSAGNVGIGSDTTPSGSLQVTGDEVRIGSDGGTTINNATGDGDLYVKNTLEVDGVSYLNTVVMTESLTLPMTSKTANYTLRSTDYLVIVNPASATTMTLPTASGIGGRVYEIIAIDGDHGTNTVTIDPSGTETISGNSTFVFGNDYESVTIISDGTNWLII
ncbi:MAG: hypothetical protein GY817_01355, partial [bacterium]|nr:hypothetical protein [bacterium]